MKANSMLGALLATVAVAGMTCARMPVAAVTHGRGLVKPAYVLGPHAVASNRAASNAYLLFTCQLGEIPGVSCYDPFQMRRAYGTDRLIDAGWSGAGRTIVIVDAFQNPNIVAQLDQFDSWYGLPGANFSQVAPYGLTPFDSSNVNMVGWALEISLDVEWAHAIAPGAKIVLVLSRSDQDSDIFAATQYAVANHLGDVISQSFGENESCMDPNLLSAQHAMFAEATRSGITLFASAGDFGAAQYTCDQSAFVRAVSTPASDPLVTGVGGTDLIAADYTSPIPGAYQSESVWNEPAYGAGGGGFSVLYSEPSYQKSVLHGGKQRGLPDIAYNASVNHGVLTFIDVPPYLPAGFYLVGGTSAGSPQWAAITAIADQKNGADLGFINQALYHMGHAPPHAAQSFHDVTIGNNSFAGVTGFNAGPGWDAATGFGSPQAPGLVDLLLQSVSPGDGNSAIAQSAAKGKPAGHGHLRPH